MLCNLLAAVAAMVLGLRFRAGALIAATLVVVILCFAVQTRRLGFGWSPLLRAVLAAIALQAGYLAGLAAAALWRHFVRR